MCSVAKRERDREREREKKKTDISRIILPRSAIYLRIPKPETNFALLVINNAKSQIEQEATF